jgi:hypothetical protein
VPFPCFSHMRAGLSNSEWRALSPGEKIKRLLSTSLDRATEILSCCSHSTTPRLAAKMEVWRVVFGICVKAYLNSKLGREAARDRDRKRLLEELAARFTKSDARAV